MATEKTYSYLSSIKEVSTETKALTSKQFDEIRHINLETQKAFKLALKKEYEAALEIFNRIKNDEMAFIIKKCIELEPIFEKFLIGEISYAKYKKVSKSFPDEAKEIVQYKYPDLEFIEVRNLEKKFREKIEGIIDELLAKNNLDSLIEARKIYEKHIAVIKKPYNFDRLFIKTISFIPYSQFESLYKIQWTDVDKLINDFLLKEANNFFKAEAIINQIKVIGKNRDTIQAIIRKFNKSLDAKLRQYYPEAKLKIFVREYKKHSFYFLDKKNKINTKIELFFLQRRLYAIYYVNENYELFLEMLKENIDCMRQIPIENQRAFYHAIIRSIRVTKDYSIFEIFPDEIIEGANFTGILTDTLEEDEETIRGIVKQLKGKEKQSYFESLFLNIYSKELSFLDTKDAPEFNKEKSDAFIEKFKENNHLYRQLKVRRILFKVLAAFELILAALFALGLSGVCSFAFKKDLYFLGIVVLIGGLILGIWSFVHLEEIITLKRAQRLFRVNKTMEEIEVENSIILKKVYLGLD